MNPKSKDGSDHRSTGQDETSVETVLGILLALVIIISVSSVFLASSDFSSKNPAISTGDNDLTTHETAYSDIYEESHDSVVSVYVRNGKETVSQGTGFVYDDQYIVTNKHVVRGGDNLYVRYSNGEWSQVSVAGADKYTDLAVLSFMSKPAYAKPLDLEPENPEIGEKAAFIGSPDNLAGSLTVGVVSGVNRSMASPQNFVIPDTIQTDASLNNGNSGGPLLDTNGKVIGVARARQGENIGFAVSSRLVSSIVPSLKENGKHEHSFVGMRSTPITPSIAEVNHVPLKGGLLVTETINGTPADGVLEGRKEKPIFNNKSQSILNGGDVIYSIDGLRIDNTETLTSYLMRKTSPGDEVEFELLRDGEIITENVTLGKRP